MQWEYMDLLMQPDSYISKLNELGMRGWEVVSIPESLVQRDEPGRVLLKRSS